MASAFVGEGRDALLELRGTGRASTGGREALLELALLRFLVSIPPASAGSSSAFFLKINMESEKGDARFCE